MSAHDCAHESRFGGWRSRYFRTKHRLVNALRDFRDRWLRGRCCAMSHDLEDEAGVYYFWRCGRERGHKGPHRFVNYLWGHEGVSYSPLDRPPPMLERYPTMTRRQRKARERWHSEHAIKMGRKL